MSRQRFWVVTSLFALLSAGFLALSLRGEQNGRSGGGAEAERATSTSPRPALEALDRVTRRSQRTQSSDAPSPVRTLPAKLWELVQEFDAQGEFLGRPEGFTNEDLGKARARILPLIRELSADEIRTIIEFYHHPETWAVVKHGNDLAGSMLHIEWGRQDPASALRWLEDKLRLTLSDEDQSAQFSDPFQPLSGYDVGYMFRGWATQDVEAALSGWVESHQNLIAHDPRIPAAEAAEFDKIVRDAILNAHIPDPIHPSQ